VISYFTRTVAVRHLRYSVGQSLLTIGVVAISVLLIVYLHTTISGTQTRIVRSTTGALPHITIEPPERTPVAAWDIPTAADPEVLYIGEVVNLPRALATIEDWKMWLPYLDRADPEITAVSPIVSGQAFLFRGSRQESVGVLGVMPERHNGIVEIEANLLPGGRFLRMNSGDLVLGAGLASDFGLKLRDKVRLVGPSGLSINFTVAGIYDTGLGRIDDGQVFITLRDGQSLLQLGGAISSFGLKLQDLYVADDIALRQAPRLPFKVRSWVEDNPRLFGTLRAQGLTRDLILFMSTIASGFGIASILVMVVTSKYREIGILKAMGATPREIQSIFVLEGLMLAVIGCLVGIPLGIAVLELMGNIKAVGPGGRIEQVFTLEVDPVLLAAACAIAITTGAIASYFPARRAGQVDPMQVIRGS
jgi:lipoprotein-releasing system permease protein